jgi:hypothetical protein
LDSHLRPRPCSTGGDHGKAEAQSSVLEPDAAGIDIGAEEIYVAVPPDRDEESTRKFSTFTRDLNALAEWLERCRIRTVAMESTGVYWIPLFQILEKRRFTVYLVNAHYLEDAKALVEEDVKKAPRLIPIYGYRMMPDRPHLTGNPVLSVYQTDIIYYGFDLDDYLRHDLVCLAESRGHPKLGR